MPCCKAGAPLPPPHATGIQTKAKAILIALIEAIDFCLLASWSGLSKGKHMSAEPKEEREGPGLPEIDLREWGGRKEGERQSLDRRLFFQLLAFDVHDDVTQAISALSNAISQAHIPALLLRELNAPRTIAILSWSEDPLHFIERILPLFEDRERFAQRREYTMLGRTYSLGHEPELEHALLHRPVEYCLREGWDWHVWYPLRRSGAFER
ncbi:MAG: hypothetical protein N2515_11685, partial [Deltaproteobacteria bacterium]|nr:hypothetical protein [Deltaproteobacteria bacterium]